MFENTLFQISKLFFLIKMGKKMRKLSNKLSTADEYVKYLDQEWGKYKPGTLTLTDKNATHTARVSELFSEIDEYSVIREKYSFPFNPNLGDKENALNIMKFLTEHTFYNGCISRILPDSTVEILKYSYDNGFSHSLNCRYKAIAFTDVLLSYGIKALPICMISGQGGCHFVVHVYLKESNRFIVCDPSFNSFFTDNENTELSVFDLRKKLMNNEPVNLMGFEFLGSNRFADMYMQMFIRDNLTNISTWDTNRRSRKTYCKPLGIDFKTAVPDSLSE